VVCGVFFETGGYKTVLVLVLRLAGEIDREKRERVSIVFAM
jgi:hypothetical protein